ncbi:MAG TPA: cation-efflux pump [Terriglobia bacterium]|nr:cation-efflux pump [Terriglobia bacterium]
MKSLKGLSQSTLPAQEKMSVALSSFLAALLLTLFKAVVGSLSGSLGILSEAAHSSLDLVAALVTLFSIRLADMPADSSHPFGHGKFEHVSAFVETGLLLVTCAWIVFEAVRRLFFHAVQVEPTVWAFAVMLISMMVDASRSRSLARVAKKYSSQALEADAIHFSTDVYGSGVVVLGLLLILAADHWRLRWLLAADPVAALCVAGITVYLSVRLGKRSIDALVDAAPQGISASIARLIASVPGVMNPERIRVRQSGNQLFVDVRLTLQSNISFEHAEAVSHDVEERVRDQYPEADVVIQSAPQQPSSTDVVERVRSIAHRNDLQIHDVTPFEVQGKVNLSLDLELDPTLTLEAAHRRATILEEEIQKEIPSVKEVNVHIEPMQKRVEPANEAGWMRRQLEERIRELTLGTPGLVDCHAIEAHQVGSTVHVSLHCTFEPDLPVSRVHDITEDLELKFRKELPQIMKVSIHAEPKGSA